jgi:hypothetical protein
MVVMNIEDTGDIHAPGKGRSRVTVVEAETDEKISEKVNEVAENEEARMSVFEEDDAAKLARDILEKLKPPA